MVPVPFGRGRLQQRQPSGSCHGEHKLQDYRYSWAMATGTFLPATNTPPEVWLTSLALAICMETAHWISSLPTSAPDVTVLLRHWGRHVLFGWLIPRGSAPDAVSLRLHSDGRRDFAVANFSSSDVSILLGTAMAPSHRLAYTELVTCQWHCLGEFNGDGHTDLAVSNFIWDISILLGDGAGTFHHPPNYAWELILNQPSQAISMVTAKSISHGEY